MACSTARDEMLNLLTMSGQHEVEGKQSIG